MVRLGIAPVFGDGSQQLSAVHGADLAGALVAAGTTPSAVGKIYYACHPEIATSAELVRAVGAAMGRRVALVPVPIAGRARAARGDRGLRPTRRPDDHPHPGQGQRVLPGGVDRRSGPADPGHRMASSPRSRVRHGRHLPLVPDRGMALGGMALEGRDAGRSAPARGLAAARDISVIVSVVALWRAPDQPGCWWLLAAHALFGVLLYLVTRPGLGPVGRTVREIYPLLLLVGLYSELDVLNGPGAHAVHDATVQRWELAIFGAQVSLEWWRAMPSRFWSAVLHAAYLSYYLIVVAPAFYFVWRRDLRAAAPLRAGGHDHVRGLLSGLHLLPGRRAVLCVSPARGLVHRQRLRPDGVRHAGHRQLLRRGVPQLARGGDGGRGPRRPRGDRRRSAGRSRCPRCC